VTQDNRAKAESVINVAIAVKVKDVLVFGVGNNGRVIITTVTEIRVDPVGDDLLGAFKKFVGFGALKWHIFLLK
jgi:hypothetical protein